MYAGRVSKLSLLARPFGRERTTAIEATLSEGHLFLPSGGHGLGFQDLDLDPFRGLEGLLSLDLSGNAFEDRLDLSPLDGHPSLRRLDLEGDLSLASPEPNLSSLQLVRLPALEVLGLHLAGVAALDLTPLSQSPNLRSLDLSWNELTSIDLAPLGACRSLERLSLASNRLKTIDLAPLSGADRLELLDLHFNALSSVDLTPVAHHPGLRSGPRPPKTEGLQLRPPSEGLYLDEATIPRARLGDRPPAPVVSRMRDDGSLR